MSVKIRLQRMGRKKSPFYQIVVADSRSPRDGRYIERLGSYNPMTKPATIDIDRDKAFEWIMKGAQPTDTARAILRFKGIFYKKHLMRGVQKGAMTVEEADVKHQDWVDKKEALIAARVLQTANEKAAFHAMVNGTPPPKPVAAPQPAPEPIAPAVVAAVAEEAPEVVVEEAPAVVAEETVEQVSETPAVAEEAPETQEEEAPTEE